MTSSTRRHAFQGPGCASARTSWRFARRRATSGRREDEGSGARASYEGRVARSASRVAAGAGWPGGDGTRAGVRARAGPGAVVGRRRRGREDSRASGRRVGDGERAGARELAEAERALAPEARVVLVLRRARGVRVRRHPRHGRTRETSTSNAGMPPPDATRVDAEGARAVHHESTPGRGRGVRRASRCARSPRPVPQGQAESSLNARPGTGPKIDARAAAAPVSFGYFSLMITHADDITSEGTKVTECHVRGRPTPTRDCRTMHAVSTPDDRHPEGRSRRSLHRRARRSAAPAKRAVAVTPKARLYDNILERDRRYPHREDQRIRARGASPMYAKAEFFNLLLRQGSVRAMRSSPSRNCQTLPRPTDRHFMCSGFTRHPVWLSLASPAERKGLLKPGDTVVEATSGNTGIAVAMVCARAATTASSAWRSLSPSSAARSCALLGAKVIVTPRLVRAPVWWPRRRNFARSTVGSSAPSSRTTPTRRSTPPPPAPRSSGFRRQAAGLLRHRLRHRRNLPGRRPRHQGGAPGHQDCPPRARSCWPHRVRYQD